jgi:hypothetical protein
MVFNSEMQVKFWKVLGKYFFMAPTLRDLHQYVLTNLTLSVTWVQVNKIQCYSQVVVTRWLIFDISIFFFAI